MKNIFKKLGILGFVLALFCFSVLALPPVDAANPLPTTSDATNIDETTVTLNGAITNLTEDNSTVYFYYKKTADASYTKSATQVLTTNTTYTVDLTGLTRDTDYTYFASATNANLSTEYNDTTTKTFTTLKTESERNVIAGVGTTKTIIYTAFSLIALMILVGAAVLIYTMFSGAMDPGALLQITLWSIGGAIILAVGTVIIGLVAQAILG